MIQNFNFKSFEPGYRQQCGEAGKHVCVCKTAVVCCRSFPTMADQRQGATLPAPSEPSIPEDPPVLTTQQKAEMMADEDPLLISQSLTYVTDDGSVLHSFQSAPFSTGASLLQPQHW